MTIPFDQIRLQTARLVLRPFRDGDAAGLYAIYSDPDVCRYLPRGAWTDLSQAHERIAKDIAAMATNESLRLAIVTRDDDKVIGDCCLFAFMKQCRRAELGYSQARSAWGNGYLSEALHALVEFAFSELDLIRLEADIDPRNGASARSLGRLGFTKEGHLRDRWIVEGEVSDTGLYGLLRSDWQLQGPKPRAIVPQLRIARPVSDLARSREMYVRGLGLAVVGSFADHEGFDGVMLGVAGGGYQFEFTHCGAHPVRPSPTSEDLAVFYLPSRRGFEETCANMLAAGFAPIASFNPFWDANGRTFEDADGYRVVLQNAAWAIEPTSRS